MYEQPSFYSAEGNRPTRLSKATRTLAQRALSGEFGRSMIDLPLSLDDIQGIDSMSDVKKYAAAIRKIAEHAPLRLDPDELLTGSATLELARKHYIPVYYKGNPLFPGISHLTCGFDRMIKSGFRGLREQILARLSQTDLDSKGKELLEAMLSCLDSMKIWHGRYLSLIIERMNQSSEYQKAHYTTLLENCGDVPENPPQTFRQALQSLWFMFAFLRLCGNWPGIGRIDVILGPYLKNDLEKGKISLDEARELLAHFWIKGCEWITLEGGGSGDAQHYQNIVLGGIYETGREVTNEVTYLILDIVEELGISDFPIAVRVNRNTPETLLQRVAEVQHHGGGVVGVYNEKLIIDSMVNFGYELSEAQRFTNDGCWEVQVPGKTCFSYYPFDMLAILQSRVLHITDGKANPIDYSNFKQLYSAFISELRMEIETIQRCTDGFAIHGHPGVLVALFTDGCIQNARDYLDRGAKYNVLSPHAGGLPDTANSLLAIKHLVYDEKRITLPELVQYLRNNWEGQELLRRHIANTIEYFGNDSLEADAMAKCIYDDYVSLVLEKPVRNGVLCPPGISTFGRQIDWRWNRGATADGHFKGEILSGNLSPAPGTNKKGATAIIKSHCSLGLLKLTCGTALDIKLLPDTVKGEKGVETLISLIKGFIQLGGFFMQTDIINHDVLLEAQKNPEKFQNLAVRVSGWSARFITLNKEWQEMIISRTAQGV